MHEVFKDGTFPSLRTACRLLLTETLLSCFLVVAIRMESPCDGLFNNLSYNCWAWSTSWLRILSFAELSRRSERVHGGLHDDWIPHTPIYILPGEGSKLPRYSCRPKLLVDKKYRECGLASGFLRSLQMEDDEAFKFSSSCLSGAGFSSKCKYNLPFLVTMQNLNLILTTCRPHRQHSSGIYEIQCGRYNEGFSDTLRQRASLRDTLFNSTDTRHWFLRGSRWGPESSWK